MKRRAGLTLLEVVVSLGLFMTSVVALGALINGATARALDVQQQAEASMLCQGKLSEVIAGFETGDSGEIKQNDTVWRWTVAKNPADLENLTTVQVVVRLDRPDGTVVQATLNQMVLDPTMRGTTQLPDPATGSSSSSTPPAATTPSSSGTPSAGTPPTTTPSTSGSKTGSTPAPPAPPTSGSKTGSTPTKTTGSKQP